MLHTCVCVRAGLCARVYLRVACRLKHVLYGPILVNLSTCIRMNYMAATVNSSNKLFRCGYNDALHALLEIPQHTNIKADFYADYIRIISFKNYYIFAHIIVYIYNSIYKH